MIQVPPSLPLVTAALVVGILAVRWTEAVVRGAVARRRRAEVAAPPRAWPTVSVIVPAWRERGTVEPTLAALASVRYPAFDVVVVAGGEDGTYEVAAEAIAGLDGWTVIAQPDPPTGKPGALNAGVAASTGEIVVFLDADTIVEPGWLTALVAPLAAADTDLHGVALGSRRQRPVVASTGNLVPTRSTPVSRAELLERASAYEVRRRFVLQGAGSIAIRRDVLMEVGPFPDDAYADDWDLDARLAIAGHRRAYCPEAVVRTERPATILEYWANEVRWRRAHLASARRLPGYFLAGFLPAARTIFPYALAWAIVLGTAVTVVAFIVADPAGRGALARAWAIAGAGVLAERLALPIEVMVYRRDAALAREAWIPPVLWVMTLAAGWLATLTWRRVTLGFKGPRPVATPARTLPPRGPR
jgi:biofilm PGA synthesis N-glycosyltransferase PgaC